MEVRNKKKPDITSGSKTADMCINTFLLFPEPIQVLILIQPIIRSTINSLIFLLKIVKQFLIKKLVKI